MMKGLKVCLSQEEALTALRDTYPAVSPLDPIAWTRGVVNASQGVRLVAPHEPNDSVELATRGLWILTGVDAGIHIGDVDNFDLTFRPRLRTIDTDFYRDLQFDVAVDRNFGAVTFEIVAHDGTVLASIGPFRGTGTLAWLNDRRPSEIKAPFVLRVVGETPRTRACYSISPRMRPAALTPDRFDSLPLTTEAGGAVVQRQERNDVGGDAVTVDLTITNPIRLGNLNFDRFTPIYPPPGAFGFNLDRDIFSIRAPILCPPIIDPIDGGSIVARGLISSNALQCRRHRGHGRVSEIELADPRKWQEVWIRRAVAHVTATRLTGQWRPEEDIHITAGA